MARKNGPPLPAFTADGIPEEDRALIQRRVASHAVSRGPRVWFRLLAYRFGGWLVDVGERLQLWAG